MELDEREVATYLDTMADQCGRWSERHKFIERVAEWLRSEGWYAAYSAEELKRLAMENTDLVEET